MLEGAPAFRDRIAEIMAFMADADCFHRVLQALRIKV
jgi:hypothetical protein